MTEKVPKMMIIMVEMIIMMVILMELLLNQTGKFPHPIDGDYYSYPFLCHY
jgi:hypothetical protein